MSLHTNILINGERASLRIVPLDNALYELELVTGSDDIVPFPPNFTVESHRGGPAGRVAGRIILVFTERYVVRLGDDKVCEIAAKMDFVV